MVNERDDDLGPADMDPLTPREFIQRAREHHARTGEWPPDPILDEIYEIRRQIMAENGNDWRKVLRWHAEQARLYAEQHPEATFLEKPVRSAGVSGR